MRANYNQQARSPVVDPLRDCDEANDLYDNITSISDAQMFILMLHIVDGRTHVPVCPAHDPNLLGELRSKLEFDKLPD